jgi:oligoribonuclease
MTMILWVDLETTGLDPREHHLLEIAAVLTDASLEEVDGHHAVFYFDDDEHRLTFEPAVQDMHTANGLWNECKNGHISVQDHEEIILQMLRDHGCSPREVLLGGSTINFDREWLEEWMPILFNYLHYRNIDISTLKRTLDIWLPEIAGISPQSDGIHRARPDIMASINYMKFYRDFILNPRKLTP